MPVAGPGATIFCGQEKQEAPLPTSIFGFRRIFKRVFKDEG
jgi:hypothetical protein